MNIITKKEEMLDEFVNVRTLCILIPKISSENNKNFEKLMKDGFYAFHKIPRRCDHEDSYFIYNISLGDAKRLDLEYTQGSFIFMTNYGGNHVFSVYKYSDGNRPFWEHIGDISGHISNEKDATELFALIGKQFNLNIPFDDNVFETVRSFVKKYNEILDNNKNDTCALLDDIMDDNKTGHAKYISRMLLYGRSQQH